MGAPGPNKSGSVSAPVRVLLPNAKCMAGRNLVAAEGKWVREWLAESRIICLSLTSIGDT